MAVPEIARAFVESDYVRFVDNGNPPRSDYGVRQFDNHKIGLVDHIPVADDLETQLTPYFLSGRALGASHFGTDRKLAGWFEWNGMLIPVALVDQYISIIGPYSPWAQGVRSWVNNPACSITVPPYLLAMPPVWANPGFISFENCATVGTQGMTDPQFNARVLVGCYVVGYFGFPINGETFLWHGEFSPTTRCFDPGWGVELQNALIEASHKIMNGDLSGLRGVQGSVPEEEIWVPNTMDFTGWPLEEIFLRRNWAINNLQNVALQAQHQQQDGPIGQLSDYDYRLLEDLLARRNANRQHGIAGLFRRLVGPRDR